MLIGTRQGLFSRKSIKGIDYVNTYNPVGNLQLFNLFCATQFLRVRKQKKKKKKFRFIFYGDL